MNNGFDWTVLTLRVLASWRLAGGVWPYVSGTKPMSDVITYFESLNLPLPEAAAYLSVYSQFLCSILIGIGWFVRHASTVMVFNFIIAIVFAHIGDSITGSFAAIALLTISANLACFGPGRFSVDNLTRRV
jgi:uncharacterized membrane protein YphA (DoxX/SURF4 family)